MTNETCLKIKYVLKCINCYPTAFSVCSGVTTCTPGTEKKNVPNIFGREFPDGHSQDKQVTV